MEPCQGKPLRGKLEFYKEIYTNGEKVLLRHDYRELVEISLRLLGSELPGEKQFNWKKIGAVHKAQFMEWVVTVFSESFCLLKSNGLQ